MVQVTDQLPQFPLTTIKRDNGYETATSLKVWLDDPTFGPLANSHAAKSGTAASVGVSTHGKIQ
jgi:hypothetical protein